MKKISIYLSIGLAAITLMIGIGIGYSTTSDYTEQMYNKSKMDLGEADFFLDRRYLNAMISHHLGAIKLAEQALVNGQHQEIKNLATEIIANEPTAIAGLYRFKKDWYGDTRQVSSPKVVNLGQADDTSDLRFLNALIAHHQTGLQMTTEVKLKSSRSAILDNADAVSLFLSTSLEQLQSWRKDWYKI
jgi:uncharacterized protein (DUF305 family)